MTDFTYSPTIPRKPGALTAVGVMTLLNGLFNIAYGLTLTFGFAVTIVGLVCTPLTILPTILGIFETFYAIRLLKNPLPRGTRPSQALAIWQIIAVVTGNLFSPVVGILALVFYSDTNVAAYFAEINNG